MACSLEDLSLASKRLLEFQSMYDYENRLKTFTDWPFTEGCQCTPENMAQAGFIHCPTENGPDVAQCFFCLRELEGWEPDDDPWMEHCNRSSNCAFITLRTNFDDLTMEEFIRLELERMKCFYPPQNYVVSPFLSCFMEEGHGLHATADSAFFDLFSFKRKHINRSILLFEEAFAATTNSLLEYCATCHQCTIELDP
uniref:Baculoviral IAP repeat-containing protein 5.1-like isoform X1 n=1 Tax=Geotrypetes seraphini TaxID=260995 RepID=A0A6P8Q5C2_GEOSA|nr:baculoviral IAP repeat-containing protein 5.1-like isoform X1 [Geotrypetes seraphini]